VALGRVKRLRLACPATVHSGAEARGGLPRGDNQARAHAMGGKEHEVPCGSVAEERAELTLPFGRADTTSDGIVGGLAAQWDAWAAPAQAATRLGGVF
jgi:hypothetical protein